MDLAGLSPHDQAMVAKWDASSSAHSPTAEVVVPPVVEPAAVETPAAQTEPKQEPAATETTTEPPKDEAAEAVKAAKLDMGQVQSEYDKDGALSEATYKALDAAGISKDIVDSYIAGREALVQRAVDEAYTVAGGKDQYSAMLKWAATGLNAAEQSAFNDAVMGNPAQTKQAIIGLKAQYEAAFGQEPKLASATNAGADSGETPFASRAEVTTAMRDPRYRNDPAYRAMVERKLDGMASF